MMWALKVSIQAPVTGDDERSGRSPAAAARSVTRRRSRSARAVLARTWKMMGAATLQLVSVTGASLPLSAIEGCTRQW